MLNEQFKVKEHQLKQECMNEINNLTKDNESLMQNNQSLLSEISKLKNSTIQLKAESNNKEKEYSAQLSIKAKENNGLNARIEEMTEINKQIELSSFDKCNYKDEKINMLQTDMNKMIYDSKAKDNQLEDMEFSINEVKQQNGALKNKIKTISNKCSFKDQIIEQMKLQKDKLLYEIELKEKDKVEYMEINKRDNEQYQQLEKEKRMLETHNKELKISLTQTNDQIKKNEYH